MYDTIIFDMDGTILDTLDDLTDSMNFIMRKYGYQQRTREEIRSFVGNGVNRLIKLAVPGCLDEEEFHKVVADYKQYYLTHCQIKTKLYDGIAALMKTLKDRKIKMAIVSNKHDAAVKELAIDYFSDFVDIAIGQQEGIEKKPAPDMVNEAMRVLRADKQNTLYVGDSEVDKETADNAGIDCVLVDWGFRDRHLLEKLNAKSIISDPNELAEFL